MSHRPHIGVVLSEVYILFLSPRHYGYVLQFIVHMSRILEMNDHQGYRCHCNGTIVTQNLKSVTSEM